MLGGDRDLRTAPARLRPARRVIDPPITPGFTRLAFVARCRIAGLALFLTGCQSFASPLATWRAAYDGNLVAGPTKEEMADVERIVERV